MSWPRMRRGGILKPADPRCDEAPILARPGRTASMDPLGERFRGSDGTPSAYKRPANVAPPGVIEVYARRPATPYNTMPAVLLADRLALPPGVAIHHLRLEVNGAYWNWDAAPSEEIQGPVNLYVKIPALIGRSRKNAVDRFVDQEIGE